MRIHAKLLTALFGIALLSGCTGGYDADVAKLKMTTATGGTAFTRALADQYKAYANYEADVEMEWAHAGIFARKGLRAAGGEMVSVDEVSAWEIPANRTADLVAARAKLMAHFQNGARERQPEIAAEAQVKLECWMEEEWEGEADGIKRCRDAFTAAEAKLNVVAAAPKIVKTFIVYFDLNKDVITADAQKVLDDVKKSAAEIKPTNIFLAGHTDTTGSSGYNTDLSNRRVKAVGSALSKMGVSSSAMATKYHGESMLAVKTDDNVKEAKNRRVEIMLEK
jgi:OOP family OmpA-OmpF porin